MKLLELLLLSSDYIENEEGFVITFGPDGQMAKRKHTKYLSLHGLIGPDAFRENLLVKTILDGNIDDVIAALVPGVKKDKIIEMDEKVTHHFNHLVQEFIVLRDTYFNEYKENRKEYALNYKHHPLFSSIMKTLFNTSSVTDLEKLAEEAVALHILLKCKSLNNAKEYLDKI